MANNDKIAADVAKAYRQAWNIYINNALFSILLSESINGYLTISSFKRRNLFGFPIS